MAMVNLDTAATYFGEWKCCMFSATVEFLMWIRDDVVCANYRHWWRMCVKEINVFKLTKYVFRYMLH